MQNINNDKTSLIVSSSKQSALQNLDLNFSFDCFLLFNLCTIHKLIELYENEKDPTKRFSEIEYLLLQKIKRQGQIIDPKIRNICSYKIIYNPSKNNLYGRIYSSFTSISKQVRNSLLFPNYYDFDLSNSFPNIINYLCKINNITLKILPKYLENRHILGEKDEQNFKKLFLAILNDAENKIIVPKDENYAFFLEWQLEAANIRTKLINEKNGTLFRVMEDFEIELLKSVIFFLIYKKKWIYSLLLHDGIYLLKNITSPELIKSINSYLFFKYNYPFTLLQKPIEKYFSIKNKNKKFNTLLSKEKVEDLNEKQRENLTFKYKEDFHYEMMIIKKFENTTHF